MNPASPAYDVEAIAARLADAWKAPPYLTPDQALPPDRAGAFAVQDATLRRLGPTGGWKVGARGPDAEPACAPLPAGGLLPSASLAPACGVGLRGVEVELAVRLGHDLPADRPGMAPADLARCIDAVLPVIELVDSRLSDWKSSPVLAQLADLQNHGALIVGTPVLANAAGLDLRLLEARLAFDGDQVAHTRGGNPAADLWRLLGWLAWHCSQRGQPLRAGQIITTGSCTGLLFAPAGARIQASLSGLGEVEMQF